MRKREKFIISSLLLALGLIATQLLSVELRPLAIILFFLASYLISGWALAKELNGIEWLTIVPFPALYALSVSLFYFLLPSNLFSRTAVIVLFGVGMYGLYLMSNIYAIGKVKTIQLLRAAYAVGSLFLLLMSLFFFNFIFSLGLYGFINAFLVVLVSFPMLFCAIWSLELEQRITKRSIVIALLFSVILGEVAFAISLIPVGLWTASLFLTSLIYIGFGLIQHYFEGRLFAKTVREYATLGAFVTISLILLINWK
jgi:hypothetical protein